MYFGADRASTVTTVSGSTLFLLHNWLQKIRKKNMPGQIYPLLKNEIIFLILSRGSTLFVSNCPFYSLPGSLSRVMVFDLFQISSLCGESGTFPGTCYGGNQICLPYGSP